MNLKDNLLFLLKGDLNHCNINEFTAFYIIKFGKLNF